MTVTSRMGRITHHLADVRQDLAFGARLIRRSPGFSAVAALTLALGIGANTAVFSVFNALLFTPLPIAASHEVMRIHSGQSTTSWPNYEDIRQRSTVFSAVAAHRHMVTGLATQDTPVRLRGEATSINFLSVLGVDAALGRTFSEADARRDLVVLADHVWRGRFGADPAIAGRVLMLGGRPYEVTGVMPPGFRGVAPPGLRLDFWLPVDTTVPDPMLSDRALSQFEAIGRLRPNSGRDEALAEMRVIAQRMHAEYPELADAPVDMDVFSVEGIGAFTGMASVIVPVLAFLGLMTVVSGSVLLIACANIAGLLIGRATARRREIAMRLALGAGRGRLVRQLLTESVLLALLGGVAGIALAVWLASSVNVVTSRLPIPVVFDLGVDRRVLTYTLALTTFTSIVFGLAPALRARRFDLVSSLKDESTGSTGRQRLRHALVIGQVAVCSALLVWSGLFLRSLSRINDVDPGFNPVGVLLATVMLERDAPADRRSERIFVALQDRVREVPGVESAGMASVIPLALTGREGFFVRLDGDGDGARHRVLGNRVTPGWFSTVQIPLVAGRDFTWDDREGGPGVAIVNETLARRFWDGDAVGQRLLYGDRTLEVVGVVRDSKCLTLGETIAPTVYLSFRQTHTWFMTLHARTTDVQAASAAITQEMARLAPEVVVDFAPMTEAVGAAVIPARVGAIATAAFGVVAMLLSALGIYGLVSFVVVQRTRELGVRRAIGADTPAILRLVVASSARLTAVGLLIGLCGGGLGGVALGGFIFGVSPADPGTLLGVAAAIMGTTILASLPPALRAARVSPLVALRSE